MDCIAKGKKRLALIEDRKNLAMIKQLRDGLSRAYKENGMEFDGYIEIPKEYRSSYLFLKEYVKDGVPYDVVITYRDSQAMAVMNTVKEAGMNIPDDVELVCILDSKYNSMARPQICLLYTSKASARAGAPFGEGCRKALDYMLELGRKEGFEVKDYDGYAGVISYGEGTESVGVLAHLDIVPLGDGWTKDPYGGEIEQGYLFGRGALDDKGPAMAGFYALKMLKDKGIQLDRKIMLILGCNEETGMECMKYYTQHGEIPTMGFTPDADFPVIYGEKGGLHAVSYTHLDVYKRQLYDHKRLGNAICAIAIS